MDDLKIVIWIILGLVYLFTRGKKKTAPRPQPEVAEVEDVPSPEKPLTFEELLREIEGMKQPAQAAPPPKPEPVYVDYDDDIKVEKQIEDTNYDYRKHDNIYQDYEDARQKAFLRPSLEDTIQLKDTIIKFGPSKGYETATRSTQATEYQKVLRNREEFRKAFVLSEILKPKF